MLCYTLRVKNSALFTLDKLFVEIFYTIVDISIIFQYNQIKKCERGESPPPLPRAVNFAKRHPTKNTADYCV